MRANFISYSSAVGRARFHITLIPKYRHKIFGYERIKTFCARMFEEILSEQGARIIEIGFDLDHVHLVIELGINLSISRMMQLLKGKSSRKRLLHATHFSGWWLTNTIMNKSPKKINTFQ